MSLHHYASKSPRQAADKCFNRTYTHEHSTNGENFQIQVRRYVTLSNLGRTKHE